VSFFTGLVATIIPLIEILGIITAFHAVLYVRSSKGAIAWAILLVAFPVGGLPFYWIFGRNRFYGYLEALRAGNIQSNNLFGRVISSIKEFESDYVGITDHVFSKLTNMPFTDKNHARILIDGEETFDAIFGAIKFAKHYILLEFFIVRDDDIGSRLKDLLIERAIEGVKIYFIFDEIGSNQLDKQYISDLTFAGVNIIPFFTTRGIKNRFQLNFRNHRKIVVVDGESAFVGGLNVGDEYLGKKKKYGKRWRDTHLKIQGPSVTSVQLVFAGDWFWASRKNLDINWKINTSPEGDMKAVVIPSDPSHKLDTCLLFFLNAISSAKKKIWIASPYFVPDNSIIEALQLAALRGVDVRLILPGVPDKKIVYLASFAFMKRLFIPGIKIYRYKEGFMHQKVMILDDETASIGSANLDNRSFYLNFELTVLIKDRLFADKVKSMLEEDIQNSELIIYPDRKKSSMMFRLAARFASLFSPVL